MKKRKILFTMYTLILVSAILLSGCTTTTPEEGTPVEEETEGAEKTQEESSEISDDEVVTIVHWHSSLHMFHPLPLKKLDHHLKLAVVPILSNYLKTNC